MPCGKSLPPRGFRSPPRLLIIAVEAVCSHPSREGRCQLFHLVELSPGALRAEHRQVVVDVEIGAPFVGRVFVGAWLTAALVLRLSVPPAIAQQRRPLGW